MRSVHWITMVQSKFMQKKRIFVTSSLYCGIWCLLFFDLSCYSCYSLRNVVNICNCFRCVEKEKNWTLKCTLLLHVQHRINKIKSNEFWSDSCLLAVWKLWHEADKHTFLCFRAGKRHESNHSEEYCILRSCSLCWYWNVSLYSGMSWIIECQSCKILFWSCLSLLRKI